MLRNSILKTTTLVPLTAARRSIPVSRALCAAQQARGAHAISNPTLANIEKRWEDMAPQEQAELWMQLRDRMKIDWKEMTLQEKKAGMHTRSQMCPEAAVEAFGALTHRPLSL